MEPYKDPLTVLFEQGAIKNIRMGSGNGEFPGPPVQKMFGETVPECIARAIKKSESKDVFIEVADVLIRRPKIDGFVTPFDPLTKLITKGHIVHMFGKDWQEAPIQPFSDQEGSYLGKIALKVYENRGQTIWLTPHYC